MWVWALVPIAGIYVAIVAIYTEHKQKMAMIEKGMKPEEFRRAETPRRGGMAVGGFVLMGMGLAFLVAQVVADAHKNLYVAPFFFLSVGIDLTVGYYVVRKPEGKPSREFMAKRS